MTAPRGLLPDLPSQRIPRPTAAENVVGAEERSGRDLVRNSRRDDVERRDDGLIENGGFEDGDRFWSLEPTMAVRTDPALAHSGFSYLENVYAGAAKDFVARHGRMFPVAAGQAVILICAFSNATATAAQHGARIAWYDGDGDFLSVSAAILSAGAAWNRQRASLTVPAGAAFGQVELYATDQTAGALRWDSVRVKRSQAADATTTAVPVLLLANITAIIVEGNDGEEQPGFDVAIPTPTDSLVQAFVVQWKRSTDPDSAAEEKRFRKSPARILGSIRSRQNFSFAYAYEFEGGGRSDFSAWVGPVRSLDARIDDTQVTAEARVKNSSFERNGPSGLPKFWTVQAGTWTSVTNDFASHRKKYIASASGIAAMRQNAENRMDCSPGEFWFFSIEVVKIGTAAFDTPPADGVYVQLQWWDRDGGSVAPLTGPNDGVATVTTKTPGTSWSELIGAAKAPPNAAQVGVAYGIVNKVGTGTIGFDRVQAHPQIRARDTADGAMGTSKLALDAVTLVNSDFDNAGGVVNSASPTWGNLFSTNLQTKKDAQITAVVTWGSNSTTVYAQCEFRLIVEEDAATTVIDQSGPLGAKDFSGTEEMRTRVPLSGKYTLLSGEQDNLTIRLQGRKLTSQNGRWDQARITSTSRVR